jgi:hypothetical protein
LYFCGNPQIVKRLLAFLLFIITASSINFLHAQSDITNQSQLWLRYNPRVTIFNDLRIKADLDQRVYLPNLRQHQYVGRAQLEFDVTNDWKVSGGFSYFQTALPQDPNVDVVSYGEELRPELETNYKIDVQSNLSFSQRIRTDFRFMENATGFSYSNTRFRYMAMGTYSFLPAWKVTVWDEIHVNGLASESVNFFDQNRIGMNVTWAPKGVFAYDIMYFNMFHRRSAPDSYYNRQIVRFTLIHTIDAFDQSARCSAAAGR